MTVRAGTSLVEMEAALEEQGQMLSFEPPTFGGQASIGGTLACNLSGPSRPWSGSVRDMVLGVKLINGKSEQLNFGGQVMKNVAGYDVSRMQAGAMGSLGIITEISLKVMPKHSATLTLTQDMDAQQAIETMNQLTATAKPLTAACWVDNKLYLRLSGADSAVKGTAEQWKGEIAEDGAAFWQALREQQLGFFSGNAPLWRFSIKSTAKHFSSGSSWLIDWGGAQRWLRGADECDNHERSSLERQAIKAQGQVSLFRGGDRCSEVSFSQPEALVSIHRRLKSAFDPDRLFNPGRLYSWL
jgi:glycolate oxidase FAD binding subunit